MLPRSFSSTYAVRFISTAMSERYPLFEKLGRCYKQLKGREKG